MWTVTIPLILVARGCPDPRVADVTRAVVQAVAERTGSRVRAAFLEAEVPRLPAALLKEAGLGHRRAIVVPLLLTDGYHARIKVAAGIDAMMSSALPLAVRLSRVIGPVDHVAAPNPIRDLMVEALVRRLAGVLTSAPDGVVLAACGSPVSRSVAAIDALARALGSAMAVPCRPGYLSMGRPTVAEAVAALCQRGLGRVAVATYLLGTGRRFGQVLAEAAISRAVAVAPPLESAPELIEIVLRRAAQAEAAW